MTAFDAKEPGIRAQMGPINDSRLSTTATPVKASNELTRRIYEGLRNRPDGVSASELADIALANKGIDDPSVRATFVTRFLVRLGGLALREHVERIGGGQGVRWKLVNRDGTVRL
jgi:hypothetical protein